MNIALLIAGLTSIIVGTTHSVLGERTVLKELKHASIDPRFEDIPISETSKHILWATWHIASIFGWLTGVTLIGVATNAIVIPSVLISCIAVSMASCGALVLTATKAKHPGWLGLFLVAILCWVA